MDTAKPNLHGQVRDLWQTLCHIHQHSDADPDMVEVHRLATIALREVNELMDAVVKVANAIVRDTIPELKEPPELHAAFRPKTDRNDLN